MDGAGWRHFVFVIRREMHRSRRVIIVLFLNPYKPNDEWLGVRRLSLICEQCESNEFTQSIKLYGLVGVQVKRS
jgi:hypothetical protein